MIRWRYRFVALAMKRAQARLPVRAMERRIERIGKHERLRKRVADAQPGAGILQIARVTGQRPTWPIRLAQVVFDATGALELAFEAGDSIRAAIPGSARKCSSNVARGSARNVSKSSGWISSARAVFVGPHREDEADMVVRVEQFDGRLWQRG